MKTHRVLDNYYHRHQLVLWPCKPLCFSNVTTESHVRCFYIKCNNIKQCRVCRVGTTGVSLGPRGYPVYRLRHRCGLNFHLDQLSRNLGAAVAWRSIRNWIRRLIAYRNYQFASAVSFPTLFTRPHPTNALPISMRARFHYVGFVRNVKFFVYFTLKLCIIVSFRLVYELYTRL